MDRGFVVSAWVCGVREALLSVGWPWGWAGTRGQLSLSVHVLLCHQASENSKFQTWPRYLSR